MISRGATCLHPQENTAEPLVAPATRVLIIHYHLFKNAGTSIDEMLQSNFGTLWTSREFPTARQPNSAAVADFVRKNSQVLAISSHTALLPAPQIDGVFIFPIIFVRHPIDRLRSAYDFERRQAANTMGTRVAKSHDFAGYVREFLRNPRHRQVRNFQTFRLSLNEPAASGSERERALRTLSRLPFVGTVDDYEASVERLGRLLRPHFPAFRAEKIHRNKSKRRCANLPERLLSIEAQLGQKLCAELWDANQDDLAVYAASQNLSNSR